MSLAEKVEAFRTANPEQIQEENRQEENTIYELNYLSEDEMGKSRPFGAKVSDKVAENKDKGQMFDS